LEQLLFFHTVEVSTSFFRFPFVLAFPQIIGPFPPSLPKGAPPLFLPYYPLWSMSFFWFAKTFFFPSKPQIFPPSLVHLQTDPLCRFGFPPMRKYLPIRDSVSPSSSFLLLRGFAEAGRERPLFDVPRQGFLSPGRALAPQKHQPSTAWVFQRSFVPVEEHIRPRRFLLFGPCFFPRLLRRPFARKTDAPPLHSFFFPPELRNVPRAVPARALSLGGNFFCELLPLFDNASPPFFLPFQTPTFFLEHFPLFPPRISQSPYFFPFNYT